MNPTEYLKKALIPIRLSCVKKDGWPTTVSLWYIYLEEKIFCASRESSKIVNHLSNNPKCGFEVAGDLPPYRGVRGFGYAKLDNSKGIEILKILIKKYLKDDKSSLAKFLLKVDQKEVAIEIKPLSLYQYDYSDRMKGVIVNKNE
ncbi:MAG: pyridoxamine 5'-phosphate oxidase family protein [Nitrososphaeraceae archaeon]